MELPRGFDFDACGGVADGCLLQKEEVDLTKGFSVDARGKFLCFRHIYYKRGD